MSQAGKYVNDPDPTHPNLKSISGNDTLKVFGDATGNIKLLGGVLPVNNLVTRNINTYGNPGINTEYINLNNSIILGDIVGLANTVAALTLQTGSIFFGDASSTQTVQWPSNFARMDAAAGVTPLMRMSGNTANMLMGFGISATALSNDNTAYGDHCLSGINAGCSRNTGIGSSAGRNIVAGAPGTSSENTMCGYKSMFLATTAVNNCAYGSFALSNLTTGTNNLVAGFGAALQLLGAESNSIILAHPGVTGESNVIRIGQTGAGAFQQNKCWVAGIRGTTTTINDAIPVLIDSAGQLGTVSSSLRYKQNIVDMDIYSERILLLRPVIFEYKGMPGYQKISGLIAEEVATVFPELVVYKEGEPETVKYHDLAVLLLNELQKLRREFNEFKNKELK